MRAHNMQKFEKLFEIISEAIDGDLIICFILLRSTILQGNSRVYITRLRLLIFFLDAPNFLMTTNLSFSRNMQVRVVGENNNCCRALTLKYRIQHAFPRCQSICCNSQISSFDPNLNDLYFSSGAVDYNTRPHSEFLLFRLNRNIDNYSIYSDYFALIRQPEKYNTIGLIY